MDTWIYVSFRRGADHHSRDYGDDAEEGVHGRGDDAGALPVQKVIDSGQAEAAGDRQLRGGRAIRRGQGYSVRVTAPLTLHQAALKQCAALVGDGSAPAGRKAYRSYADRIAAATGCPDGMPSTRSTSRMSDS